MFKKLICFVASFFFGLQVNATSYGQYSIEEAFQKADLVFLGKLLLKTDGSWYVFNDVMIKGSSDNLVDMCVGWKHPPNPLYALNYGMYFLKKKGGCHVGAALLDSFVGIYDKGRFKKCFMGSLHFWGLSKFEHENLYLLLKKVNYANAHLYFPRNDCRKLTYRYEVSIQ